MNFTFANKNIALAVLLADPQVEEADRLILKQSPQPVYAFIASLFVKYYSLKLGQFPDLMAAFKSEHYVSIATLSGFKILENQFFPNEQKINYGSANKHFLGKINSVKIGAKFWMNENLNVDKFQDGSPIFHAKSNFQWQEALEKRIPAFCYPSNDSNLGPVMGKLYNVFAIKDPSKLLPAGWTVPTDKDWTNLVKSVGGTCMVSNRLREKLLLNYAGYRTNSREALKGGPIFSFSGREALLNDSSNVNDLNIGSAGFWSSTSNETDFFWVRELSGGLFLREVNKTYGLSVRAIKIHKPQ
jgi:uncharacterized protein (TIGR02145 family)